MEDETGSYGMEANAGVTLDLDSGLTEIGVTEQHIPSGAAFPGNTLPQAESFLGRCQGVKCHG
jgi:hypothetical protein